MSCSVFSDCYSLLCFRLMRETLWKCCSFDFHDAFSLSVFSFQIIRFIIHVYVLSFVTVTTYSFARLRREILWKHATVKVLSEF